MKKINIFAMVALLAMMALPVGAQTSITTGMTQVQAGGSAPVVKAKWEMNPTLDVNGKYLGTDDSVAGGAQFNAPGVKDQNRTITLCSIVTDDDGMGDIAGVYADVYYPEGIAVGPDHTKLDSQTGSDTAGCGVLMQEDKLTVLPKADGLELFCNKIRNNNNNLPTFNGTAYNYDEICKTDGELQKETAKVYCVNKDLSYEDPSGTYNVTAMAQDTNSLTGTLDNTFQYVPLTAFAADFTNVSYGNVKLNIEKIVNGDLIFGTTGMPTVRNVGNTRMNLTVNQNDMGLGKTGILWNVGFDARVGSNVPHQDYAPNVTTTLDDALNLSETDEVDFSILVNKFPTNNSTNWTGTMTLGGTAAAALDCGSEPNPTTLTVNKIVVGGTKQISDFLLFVDGGPVTSGVAITTTAGSHTVTETPDANYNGVFSGDCNSSGVVNVPVNGGATCTLTNTLKETPVSHLIVHKVVITHVEGTVTTAADFQMTVDGGNVVQDASNIVTPGNHTVGEVSNPNYTASFSAECPGGIANVPSGGTVTCTVTNEQKFATLTLNKVVNNIHGGNHVAANFSLFASGNDATTQLTNGVSKNVAVGSLFINEQGVTGYQAAFTGDCDTSGQITLAAGDNKQCTITNTDLQPSITLVKAVDSGSASPLSFTLRVDGAFAPQSTSVGVTSNTAHAITEDAHAGYHFVSMSGTGSQGALCPTTLGGTVTLNEGETITCTIHNTINP